MRFLPALLVASLLPVAPPAGAGPGGDLRLEHRSLQWMGEKQIRFVDDRIGEMEKAAALLQERAAAGADAQLESRARQIAARAARLRQLLKEDRIVADDLGSWWLSGSETRQAAWVNGYLYLDTNSFFHVYTPPQMTAEEKAAHTAELVSRQSVLLHEAAHANESVMTKLVSVVTDAAEIKAYESQYAYLKTLGCPDGHWQMVNVLGQLKKRGVIASTADTAALDRRLGLGAAAAPEVSPAPRRRAKAGKEGRKGRKQKAKKTARANKKGRKAKRNSKARSSPTPAPPTRTMPAKDAYACSISCRDAFYSCDHACHSHDYGQDLTKIEGANRARALAAQCLRGCQATRSGCDQGCR